ncbi:MAG: FUSC family protein, partial [Actinomycetota bacterium]
WISAISSAALHEQRAVSGDALAAATYAGVDRSSVDAGAALEMALIQEAATRTDLAVEAQAALRGLASWLRSSEDDVPPGEIVEALRSAGLGRIAEATSRYGDLARVGVDGEVWWRSWRAVIGGLTWGSPAVRHAVRLAVVVAVTFDVAVELEVPNAPWIALTVVLVLRADLGSTADRVLQRVIGTAIGAVIGGVLAAAIGDRPMPLILLAGVFLVAMVATMPVNYLLWSVTITPFVLLLLAATGAEDWGDVGWRVVNTAIGGAVAYVAASLLWPVRGDVLVRRLTSSSVHAVADEADELARNGRAGIDEHHRSVATWAQARSAALAARAEPGPASQVAADCLPTIDAVADVRDQLLRIAVNGAVPPTSALRLQAADLRSAIETGAVPDAARVARVAEELRDVAANLPSERPDGSE